MRPKSCLHMGVLLVGVHILPKGGKGLGALRARGQGQQGSARAMLGVVVGQPAG